MAKAEAEATFGAKDGAGPCVYTGAKAKTRVNTGARVGTNHTLRCMARSSMIRLRKCVQQINAHSEDARANSFAMKGKVRAKYGAELGLNLGKS